MSECNCNGCKYHSHQRLLDRIVMLGKGLNQDELEVLLKVTQGLVKGRGPYGPLDINKEARSMHKETYEEIRDALVYVGVKLVQLERQ